MWNQRFKFVKLPFCPILLLSMTLLHLAYMWKTEYAYLTDTNLHDTGLIP